MKKESGISRRSFIRESSVLMSAALITPKLNFAAASKYKMGLQLFTIRDAMKADVKGTLKQVAALGYQDLETYGFDPAQIKLWIES